MKKKVLSIHTAACGFKSGNAARISALPLCLPVCSEMKNIVQPDVCVSSKRNGFTLIELLVVMVIIGILLGIATQKFSQMIAKNAMEGQMRTMLNDLMLTRSKALFNHRDIRVKITATTFTVYSSLTDTVAPVQSRTLAYPIVYSGSGTIDYDPLGFFGVVSNGNASICIEPSGSNAIVDSIVVFSTRMRIGKRNTGGDCKDGNFVYE